MQISRHWRLKPQRYRLEGFKTAKGEIVLNSSQKLELEVVSAKNEASKARVA